MTHITMPTAFIVLGVLSAAWMLWTVLSLRAKAPAIKVNPKNIDVGDLNPLMFVFAFVFLVCGFLFARYAMPAAGLSFTLAGLTCGFHDPRIRALRGDKVNLTIISVLAVLSGIGTWALSSTFSFITLVLGLIVAVAFGQCVGMVARACVK